MSKPGRVYVNRSVSFPPGLLHAARKRASNLRLSFSAYVQKCVERDLEERGAITFTETEDAAELAVADDAGVPAAKRTARPKPRAGA